GALLLGRRAAHHQTADRAAAKAEHRNLELGAPEHPFLHAYSPPSEACVPAAVSRSKSSAFGAVNRGRQRRGTTRAGGRSNPRSSKPVRTLVKWAAAERSKPSSQFWSRNEASAGCASRASHKIPSSEAAASSSSRANGDKIAARSAAARSTVSG